LKGFIRAKRGDFKVKLYLLEPEVAGGLGEETLFNRDNSVRFLHYEFYGWLGDALLETTPCFIVTELLAESLLRSNCTGFYLEDLQVSLADEFIELHPLKKLPAFKRFIPQGQVEMEDGHFGGWSGDDICMTPQKYLVVSEKALEVMKSNTLNHCEVTPLVNKMF